MPDKTTDLLLWRHAEAEDALAGQSDLERRLTPKGEKQALAMAKWLRAHGPKEPRILVSPAVRTQQTARALGLTYETIPSIAPGASVADLLAAAGWGKGRNARQAVILVGHQPVLGQVAAQLVSGRNGDWAVKKGALWWLQHRARVGPDETVIRCVLAPDAL
jgi:phosphohistidine phosphatase